MIVNDTTYWSPTGSTISTGTSQSFSLTLLQPFTHSLDVAWRVDGVLQGTGTQFTASNLSFGEHTVTATVSDPTLMVRNDPAGLLNEVHTWTLTVTPPPGAFSKSSPANGSTLTQPDFTLNWGASSFAASYEYCHDTSDNATCDTSWISAGANLGASMSALTPETTYYWQVRAVNGAGTTSADTGTWASFIVPPAMTLTTNPRGCFLTVDGIDYTAPKTFYWTVDDSHTIAASAFQACGGIRYAFISWSDGGAMSHVVTAPASSITYVADLEAVAIQMLTPALSPPGTEIVVQPAARDAAVSAPAEQAVPRSTPAEISFSGAATAPSADSRLAPGPTPVAAPVDAVGMARPAAAAFVVREWATSIEPGVNYGRLRFTSRLSAPASRAEVRTRTRGGDWRTVAMIPAEDAVGAMDIELRDLGGDVLEVQFMLHGITPAGDDPSDLWPISDLQLEIGR